jgi:hypothetical protein
MLLLAVVAAAVSPWEQARATARIVRSRQVNKDEWERSPHKREIVVMDGGRKITVRLIEFE